MHIKLTTKVLRFTSLLLLFVVVGGCSLVGDQGISSKNKSSSGTEPLKDMTLCEVVPRSSLHDNLGFEPYMYNVFHSSDLGVSSDAKTPAFECMIRSSVNNESSVINIDYRSSGSVTANGATPGTGMFADIPETWPSAEPLTLEGHEGQGWSLFVEESNSVFIYWMYPDGKTLSVQMYYSDHVATKTELNKLRSVVLTFVDVIPPVTAGPLRKGTDVTASGEEVLD